MQDHEFKWQRPLKAMQSCELCSKSNGEHKGLSLDPLRGE